MESSRKRPGPSGQKCFTRSSFIAMAQNHTTVIKTHYSPFTPFNLLLICKYHVVVPKYSISSFVASVECRPNVRDTFPFAFRSTEVCMILKTALTSLLKFSLSFITVYFLPSHPHISYSIFPFYSPSSSLQLYSHPFSDSSPTYTPIRKCPFLSSSCSFVLEPLLPKKQHFKSQDKLDRDEPEKDRKEKKKEKRNSKHQEIFDKELKATDIPMQPTEAVILSETVSERDYFADVFLCRT